jgi:hypothetical protein
MVRFNLLALVIIGLGGCVAAAKMFRWDAQQRFSRRSGKGWVAVAIAAWVLVGGMSEYRGRLAARAAAARGSASAAPPPSVTSGPPAAEPNTPAGGTELPRTGTAPPTLSEQESRVVSAAPAPKTPEPPRVAAPPPPRPSANAGPQLPHPVKSSWQDVTLEDIDRDLIFDRLPPDGGIVTPIARGDEEPDPDVSDHLEYIREMLPSWQPGKVADPVQRVRNILYVAAVPDVQQAAIERFAPQVVYDRLQQDLPKDQLVKILYWIALHPTDGEDSAVDQLWALRFTSGATDLQQVRDRAAIYAVKLLGRLLGRIPS